MTRAGEGELDAAALGDAVERAVAALGEVRKVKSQLTGATNSISNARGLLEAMEQSVRDQLEHIHELVAPDGSED
jgi:hypothetical protein